MVAGGSAQREAEASRRHAAVLAAAAAEQARRARRFSRGGAAETRTAAQLRVLSAYGYHALHDRRWPGTTSANIDHVVVGPSGVFVVDTKSWTGDLHVAADRLWRAQQPADDEVAQVVAQADAVREVVANVGLPATLVRPVIALDGRTFDRLVVAGAWVVDSVALPRAILRHSRALTETQVEALLAALVAGLPPAETSAPPAVSSRGLAAVEVPALAAPEALFSVADLEQDAVAAAMRRPFADWMVFLHPAQARFVRREFTGPARITGGAGTGKTVVALHRLAYLSQHRAQRLLYVTFVRTIPQVLKHAFERLSPDTAHRVEFSSLHSWAARFLRQRRLPCSVDEGACNRAYADAWAQLTSRALLEGSAAYRYWREEVDTVIRGRGLHQLEEYLVLDRVGRGSRLGQVQRRAVWQLADTYADNLAARGLRDWNDLLRLARDEARREPPCPAYDAIVLDEAQDMPLLAGQLLVALVGDRPDGLLFVGDDQQRVFPGGFRLAECGVDVVGRSVRFTANYRNTREVYQFAAALLADEPPAVLEDPGVVDATTAVRCGGQPSLVRAAGQSEHDEALVSSIAQWVATRAPTRTAAVLVERRAQVQRLLAVLARKGIPAMSLEDWDGARADAVIVGTTKRAKGLEFSRVYVAEVAPPVLAPEPSDGADAAIEQWQQGRREMYVAMTRARDELWIGVLDPSSVSTRPVPAGAGPARLQPR